MWTHTTVILLYQQARERSHQMFEMYGPHVDCDMTSSDIKVKFPEIYGWIMKGLHIAQV